MGGSKRIATLILVISEIALRCCGISTVPIARMPKECANEYFCTHRADNYPEELIEKMLEEIDHLFEQKEHIGHRLATLIPPNECEVIQSISPIYQIVDEAGLTRFVVQSEKRFRQVVRVERCKHPGNLTRSTRNLSDSVVAMNSFKCVEKTLDYKFVVLSLDGESMEAVRVKKGLPVCCSCQKID